LTSRVLRYLSVALVAIALVATVAGGSADAKKKRGVGKSVDSSEIEDGTIQCADIAAAVFPNGCPDDDSGAGTGTGTGTGTGGTGGGGVSEFGANLGPNQTKSVTHKSFIVSTTADGAGACTNVFITRAVSPLNLNVVTAEAKNADDVDEFLAGQFVGGQNGDLSGGLVGTQIVNFTAADLGGSPSISGTVGLTDIGGACVASGSLA
jgi:hypothetical protein